MVWDGACIVTLQDDNRSSAAWLSLWLTVVVFDWICTDIKENTAWLHNSSPKIEPGQLVTSAKLALRFVLLTKLFACLFPIVQTHYTFTMVI